MLRDVLAVCAGTPELVINVTCAASWRRPPPTRRRRARPAALSAVRRCDEAISYNVSPETCIDALLFEVKDALFGAARPAGRPAGGAR